MLTQTAGNPIQLTFDSMREKFEAHYPQLVKPLEHAKEKLDRGEGARDLANIISCEVQVAERDTAFIYTWTGQKGQQFEYQVLKPSNPTREHKPQATQKAPEMSEALLTPQEASEVPAKAPAGTEASDETTTASNPVGETAVESLDQEANPQPKVAGTPPPLSPSLFSALAGLMGDNTLLMTIAKHDDELTVNVVPFGDDKDTGIAAICLTGSPRELDEGFVEAVAVKVAGRRSLAEQVEALKAAEKELADAKKAEADAKKAEGEKKKKASEAKKKEDEQKIKQEQEAAEKAGKQEAIF